MSSGTQIKGQSLFERQAENTNFNGPVIICDSLRTPENFGSVLRVADATGCQNIILLDSQLDLTNKKISRLARSCEKHLKIQFETFESYKATLKQFKRCIALEITSSSSSLFESNIKHCDAVVIGQENTGIREELLTTCHQAVHLPMFGINGSMNLSHALVVFLYEWHRQQ